MTSTVIGGSSTVCTYYFQKMTGTQFAFVPYRGTGPALRDLIAGQIDLMLDQASSVLPHLQAGSIKAFAVTLEPKGGAAQPTNTNFIVMGGTS